MSDEARRAAREAAWQEWLSDPARDYPDALDAAIDAYEAALKEAGYVRVPREPTEAMIRASEEGGDSLYAMVHLAGDQAEADEVTTAVCRSIYRAMLSASDGEPEPQQHRDG